MVLAGLAICLAACASEEIIGRTWTGPSEPPGRPQFTSERALREEVAGWAVLGCQAGQHLEAQKCVLLGESPQGYGLGDGALRMRSGLTTAHGVGGQVLPGDWALVPIFFCPGRDRDCATRLAPIRDNFIAEVHRILALRRTGDCPGAIAAAAKLGQPAFETEIRAGCPASRRPTSPGP
jgi:hypothetical protein